MAVTSLPLPSKRTPLAPMPIPSGHVSLRILCHVSLVGAFIGKSGSSIKHLQLHTGSRVRVQDCPRPGSDHRIILIVGPSSPSLNKVKLRNCPGDVEEEEVEEEVEVSVVQESALRVFERLLEVSKEGGDGETDTLSFRVVVGGSEAGCVIGKGGKTVEKLRRESMAKIRVLLGDDLPSYVSPPDEIIEIEGDLMAVKKGILGVCGCLQQYPQGKHTGSTFLPSTLNCRVDPPLHRGPPYAATISSCPPIMAKPLSFEVQRIPQSMTTMSNTHPTTVMTPLSSEIDRPSSSDSKPGHQEVSFKILCSNDRIGGVIGRGGSIVHALEEESGAHISIGPPIANCDERVVTVTSKEDIDSRYSPAQRAVVLVFSKSSEAAAVKGHPGPNKGSSLVARILVQSNQVGCLLGYGGTIIAEMRKATEAYIRILKGAQVPRCASGDDQVVEISGQFVKVQDALYQVTSRLRSNLCPINVTSVNHSFATSQSTDGLSTSRHCFNSLHNSQRFDHSPLAGSRTSQVAVGVNSRSFENLVGGLGPAGCGLELSSKNSPVIVTNTTVEISVPEDAIGSVFGENGRNLTRIRQISGAKVIVNEPSSETSDRSVSISGTPSETQAAQSLLHAFILTGSS